MDIQTKTDIIHQKIYDFLLYIYPLLTKYPKYEKFSLQTATRNAILGESGKITKEQLQKSIQSWTGHAGHADSYNLQKKIIMLAQAAEKKGGSIS